MMLPRLSKFDVLDDMFDEPLFAKRESQIMKTDIKEKNGNYILDIDLPGCKKEDISIELNDGYLNISATINHTYDDSDTKENYIHKERFYGKCSRSFYAGENLKEEDIHASFKNGILTVSFKKDSVKDESNKKYIEISD